MILYLILFIVAVGSQVLFLVSLVVLGTQSKVIDNFLELILIAYEPFIVLIANSFRFPGEGAMIEPVWIGISMGVVIYASLFGLLGLGARGLLKRF